VLNGLSMIVALGSSSRPAHANLRAQGRHGSLSGAIARPLADVMEQLSPRTARSHQGEDAGDDLVSRHGFAGCPGTRSWDQRNQDLPLCIGHLRWVRFPSLLVGHPT
jgi:hypothetical protein